MALSTMSTTNQNTQNPDLGKTATLRKSQMLGQKLLATLHSTSTVVYHPTLPVHPTNFKLGGENRAMMGSGVDWDVEGILLF